MQSFWTSSLQLRAAAELERRRRGIAVDTACPAGPTFRGAARAVQTITAREWIIAGPSETGKTFAALWRLDTLLRTQPGSQYSLVRKVRKTIAPTVLRTYLRVVARSRSGARAYGGNNPEWYDYPNGARLWIGGMDDPGKVLSSERDGVFVNQAEELAQDDWETLSTRTTGRGAVTAHPMLFGDCNPGSGDHWIIKRQTVGQLVRLDSRHEDNPTLYDETGVLTEQGQHTMATLDALTGVRKQRLRYGLWVGAEGQYFEAFDPDIHVVAPFALHPDWLIWGALDYGFAHPTAFGLFTEGFDGCVYLIGEHIQHKWLVPQHASAIRALLGRLGIPQQRLRHIAAGLDVFAQRGDSQGKTIAEQYDAEGFALTPARVDRINGAATLLARLGNQQAGQRATFKVWSTCPRTIATIPAMVHDPHRDEDVLKVNADRDGHGGDDAYDMARYGLMGTPTGWNASDLSALSGKRRV